MPAISLLLSMADRFVLYVGGCGVSSAESAVHVDVHEGCVRKLMKYTAFIYCK